MPWKFNYQYVEHSLSAYDMFRNNKRQVMVLALNFPRYVAWRHSVQYYSISQVEGVCGRTWHRRLRLALNEHEHHFSLSRHTLTPGFMHPAVEKT